MALGTFQVKDGKLYFIRNEPKPVQPEWANAVCRAVGILSGLGLAIAFPGIGLLGLSRAFRTRLARLN